MTYLALAELGHFLSFKVQDQAITTIRPAAGLFLAALAWSKYSLWPAVLAAACGANLVSDVLLHDQSVPVSLGFFVANCGEACIGAWLLRRFIRLPLTLTHMKDVLGFACVAAPISVTFGATAGAGTMMTASGAASYWSAWQTWWIADALGVLVVAPVVLTWAGRWAALFKVIRPWRIAEGAALFLGMAFVAECVYADLLPASMTVPILILPFLLWAPLRFGPPSAAAAVLVVGLVGLWNTSQGRGPYTLLTALPNQQMLRAQGTLGMVSLSLMLLAAAVAERKRVEQERITLIVELELALNEIKTLRGLLPLCAWCKKIRNDQGFWQGLEDYLRTHSEAQFTHGMCPDCLESQLAALAGKGPDRTEG